MGGVWFEQSRSESRGDFLGGFLKCRKLCCLVCLGFLSRREMFLPGRVGNGGKGMWVWKV